MFVSLVWSFIVHPILCPSIRSNLTRSAILPSMSIPVSAVREMVSEVIQFNRSYVAWRELVEPQNRPVREDHFDFFLTVINSLVQGFCVSTYQLFDRDTR